MEQTHSSQEDSLSIRRLQFSHGDEAIQALQLVAYTLLILHRLEICYCFNNSES